MTETRPASTRPADEYRRAARRLRATLGHDRPRLYRSLQSLSARRPRSPETPEGPASRFANLVVQSLDATVLRYSERLKLLRIAKHFHIDRFKANLIIAAVQHRMKAVERTASESRSNGIGTAGVLLFIAVQTVILFLAWHVFIR